MRTFFGNNVRIETTSPLGVFNANFPGGSADMRLDQVPLAPFCTILYFGEGYCANIVSAIGFSFFPHLFTKSTTAPPQCPQRGLSCAWPCSMDPPSHLRASAPFPKSLSSLSATMRCPGAARRNQRLYHGRHPKRGKGTKARRLWRPALYKHGFGLSRGQARSRSPGRVT